MFHCYNRLIIYVTIITTMKPSLHWRATKLKLGTFLLAALKVALLNTWVISCVPRKIVSLTTVCQNYQLLSDKLKNKVLRDNCFFVVKSPHWVNDKSTASTFKTLLSFTVAHRCSNKLIFSYVEISKNEGNFTTAVYQKATNTGVHLNLLSERTDRYRQTTIKELVHKAYKKSSKCMNFYQAIYHLQEAFVNNSYSHKLFHVIIKMKLL